LFDDVEGGVNLNSTKGWSEALYNIATGEYSFKVYAVK
jgi:hypothetical protein